MNLNLTISCLLTLILSCLSINAQQDPFEDSDHELLSIKLGGLFPNEFGDNFASKAMDFEYGADLQANIYAFEAAFFFGYRFQYLRGNVTNQSLVGNYDYSNVTFNGINAGYQFSFSEKWSIEPTLSYGWTKFRNYQRSSPNNVDFEDSAQTVFVSLPVNYSLSRVFQIYFQPEFRRDFMDIETSAQNNSFFDETNFINVVAGVKLSFF